ncbi:PEP-CTERM protein-sorting domain-containing protein [Pseudarthrobacter enclensis]|nr:PEP-CTERM protein-sorting domain-containing protein [Pseudarthrobacter enclensis]
MTSSKALRPMVAILGGLVAIVGGLTAILAVTGPQQLFLFTLPASLVLLLAVGVAIGLQRSRR